LACSRALASSLHCSCFDQCWDFFVTGLACCRAWKCCGQILSGDRLLFLSVNVVSLDSLLQNPEGMALKQAMMWMLSAFGHFSCWFGLRCTQNCRSLLVAQKSSVSRHGKNFPVSIDTLGLFCVMGVSLLDLSSHMLQVNCRQFPPASPFAALNFGIWFST